MPSSLACRACGSDALESVIDLGPQPLANSLLRPEDLGNAEPSFPLEVRICSRCWMLQLVHVVPPATLFRNYVYFTSLSDEMIRHLREAACRYISEKRLGGESFVVEIGSNDGCMLRNFVAQSIPCVGMDPATNIAETARRAGIDTRDEFFCKATACKLKDEKGQADLILGNNVFAHAPDIADFVAGLAALLKPDGWIVLEFPYALEMLDNVQFDTIYHEHVFYFTLTSLRPFFASQGLEIFHVERLTVHGGSLRLFVAHQGAEQVRESAMELLEYEHETGVDTLACYREFNDRSDKVRSGLANFLNEQKAAGTRVAAYGAAAKGSTLLNCVGEVARSIEFIADRSPHKQGRLSPGLHLPVVPAEAIVERMPDYVVLLAWNFAEEIIGQQGEYLRRGGRFVVPLPELRVITRA